jgi:hypothetical protein
VTIEVQGNKGTAEFGDKSPFNISKFSFNIHELVSLLSVVNGHVGIKDIRPVRYGYRKKQTEDLPDLSTQIKNIEKQIDAKIDPEPIPEEAVPITE